MRLIFFAPRGHRPNILLPSTVGFDMVQVWFRYGPDMVQIRRGYGADTAQIRRGSLEAAENQAVGNFEILRLKLIAILLNIKCINKVLREMVDEVVRRFFEMQKGAS